MNTTIDGKTVFATVLVVGFIGLVATAFFVPIPANNSKIVDGAMVALSTSIGAAVMALLRSSRNDEKKTENTGKALDAIAATATAKLEGRSNANASD